MIRFPAIELPPSRFGAVGIGDGAERARAHVASAVTVGGGPAGGTVVAGTQRPIAARSAAPSTGFGT